MDGSVTLSQLDQTSARHWQAELALTFARQAQRTTLVRRQHHGPLVVQKMLYPEGDMVCHGIIVHPPGGVAGGDALTLRASLDESAQVLLSSPGATKWYKAGQAPASQTLVFDVSEHACLEWFPQENIVFDGAQVRLSAEVHLAKNACYAGWEVTCFGRQARQEVWQQGYLKQNTVIYRDGKPVWVERAKLTPQCREMASIAGLGGQVVMGTFVIVRGQLPLQYLEACRTQEVRYGQCGVSSLPQVVCARYVGSSAQEARDYFESIWKLLRPWYLEKVAVRPRIWNT